jgi:AraC-like DNA-binding protein
MTSENLKKESSGFGSMSHLVKDNVYLIGCSGFVYTAPWIDTRDTRPPSAAIILSVGDAPFTLSIKGRKMRAYAALVPPFIARSLHARSVPLVCFHVMPSSPRYDALKNMAQGNVAPLDRALFGRLDGELEQLYHGQLPTGRARDVYEAVLRIPFQNRTRPGQPDPRVRHIRELLEAGPDLSLTQLAHELGTSYFWASRIMTEVFGMSLRDYKSWRKMQHVFHLLHSKRSITEIAHAAGFTDSAHLSRTYQRWFGQPPSYSRNGHHVRVLRCW